MIVVSHLGKEAAKKQAIEHSYTAYETALVGTVPEPWVLCRESESLILMIRRNAIAKKMEIIYEPTAAEIDAYRQARGPLFLVKPASLSPVVSPDPVVAAPAVVAPAQAATPTPASERPLGVPG